MTSSAIECDVISRTKTERVRRCVMIFLSSFMDWLCRVRNEIMYVLSWRTVLALSQGLFWCLFPSLHRNSANKHQNKTLVSAETARHLNTYIILYILLEYGSYCKNETDGRLSNLYKGNHIPRNIAFILKRTPSAIRCHINTRLLYQCLFWRNCNQFRWKTNMTKRQFVFLFKKNTW